MGLKLGGLHAHSVGRTIGRAALIGTVMILTGTTFSIRSSSSTGATGEAARHAVEQAHVTHFVYPSVTSQGVPVVNLVTDDTIAVDSVAPVSDPASVTETLDRPAPAPSEAAAEAAAGTQTAVATVNHKDLDHRDMGADNAGDKVAEASNAAIDTQLAPASLAVDKRVVTAKRGDTLMDILVRSGVPSDDAENAITSLRKVYDPRDLKAGQDVTLMFSPTKDAAHPAKAKTKASNSKTAKKPVGDLVALRIQPDAQSEVGAKRAGDGFSAIQRQRELTTREVLAIGKIKTSLFDAAQAASVPSKVMGQMIHVFSYDVDFQRDIQPGDTFEVAYDAKLDDSGNVVDTGPVLFAQMTLSGNRISLYRYTTKDGVTDYYNARGQSVRKALMRTPVDGARLSSPFGMRKHPILGYTRMHRGVDFAAPRGTPIMAAGSGVVEVAHREHGYGNYIKIRHNADFETAYGHMNRYAKGIHAGVRVKQGEIIGYVGMTGLATGPHLHFEVIRDGKKVNPLSVHLPSGRKLKGIALDNFLASKERVDTTVAQLAANPEVASTR